MTKYAFVVLLLLAGLLTAVNAMSSRQPFENTANSALGGMGGRGGHPAEVFAQQ